MAGADVSILMIGAPSVVFGVDKITDLGCRMLCQHDALFKSLAKRSEPFLRSLPILNLTFDFSFPWLRVLKIGACLPMHTTCCADRLSFVDDTLALAPSARITWALPSASGRRLCFLLHHWFLPIHVLVYEIRLCWCYRPMK